MFEESVLDFNVKSLYDSYQSFWVVHVLIFVLFSSTCSSHMLNALITLPIMYVLHQHVSSIVYLHLLHLYRKWLLKVLCFKMIVKNIVYETLTPLSCTDDTHRLMWNGQYVWVDDTNYFTSNACLHQKFDVNKHPELSSLSTFTSHESTFTLVL